MVWRSGPKGKSMSAQLCTKTPSLNAGFFMKSLSNSSQRRVKGGCLFSATHAMP